MNTDEKTDNPLKSPKLWWGLGTFLYYIMVVATHEWVSKVYSQLVADFGRSFTESMLHAASLLLAVVMVGTCCTIILKRKNARDIRVIMLWMGIFFLIVAADRFLIVTNVERIHYPQYAILAILVIMVIPDDFLAIFFTTLGGAVDELIQFVWHPKYTKYLDFNDFVLNALGALAGVTLFLTVSSRARKARTRLRKVRASAYMLAGSIVVFGTLGMRIGWIVPLLPREGDFEVFTRVGGKRAFVLSFISNPYFWTVSEYGRTYHILSPLEGFIVLFFLLTLFRYALPDPSSA
ncbi:MAG: hypothetical protein ACMUJM_24015 [bacterium]